MVMAGRVRGSSCDTHETPIEHTHHECTAETSIGGVGSIHRTYRIVMGVARYIRHPTEPSIPRILSVPSGRELTGAVASRPQRKENEHEPRQITAGYHVRSRKTPRRWHAETYDGDEHTQNVSTTTEANSPLAGTRQNATKAGSSSFNWNIYYGRDVQKVRFNDAKKVQHRFEKTTGGYMMVIMKVRPARVINEAKLDECLQRMGLTFVATLEPGDWDRDERMIAARTLDLADKAADRQDWLGMKRLMRTQVANDMRTADKGAKKRYKADKTLVNVVEWEGAFGPEAPQGPRSVIIILPRQEKNFEIETTYNTARVAVFSNYRGDTPMHELVPTMAEAMQQEWVKSKAGDPDVHAHAQATTPLFNEWFGADMEPKGEDTDDAVESVFEVLAGTRSIRTNPNPNTDPKPDPNPGTLGNTITRLSMEGKGANGTTIKGYPRPGSRGMSKNAVAYTFQVETVGPGYEMAMDRGLKVMAAILAGEWKTETLKLVWHDADSTRRSVHEHSLCDRGVGGGTRQGHQRRDQRCGGRGGVLRAYLHRHSDDETSQ